MPTMQNLILPKLGLLKLAEKLGNLAELRAYEQRIKNLNLAIAKLESEISRCKQFNKRVELKLALL